MSDDEIPLPDGEWSGFITKIDSDTIYTTVTVNEFKFWFDIPFIIFQTPKRKEDLP